MSSARRALVFVEEPGEILKAVESWDVCGWLPEIVELI
jgi:hypothetical protein